MQPAVFSLATAEAVITILRHVHKLSLDHESKNQLRDAIFSYQINPTTANLKSLKTLFATYDITLILDSLDTSEDDQVAEVETLLPSVVKKFTRAIPHFTPVAPAQASPLVTQANTAVSVPITADSLLVANQATSPVAVEVAAVGEPEVIPVPKKFDRSVTPTPIAVPAEITTEKKVEIPASVPAVSISSNESETPFTPPTVTTPATVDSVGNDPGERINAIKRQVNARVGNPVNLIDVNNEVGREYMNALLDAMKKVSVAESGSESIRAMARLEKAFEAVMLVVNENVSAPNNEVDSVAKTSLPAAENSKATPVKAKGYQPVEVNTVNTTNTKTSTPLAYATTTDASVVPIKSVADRTLVNDHLESKPDPVTSIPPVSPTVDEDKSNLPGDTMEPVGKEKQLRELMDARTAEQQQAAVEQAALTAANPLMAPDVSSGLSQLLSEWKLFKAGGIFGTGPSAIDHPLYKQLAPLTMAAVLAGRYDSANNEVKESISAYMNGWRYEEGITYEAGETFEHYLRRVIRHILDTHKPE